jgi:hypothetical protein
MTAEEFRRIALGLNGATEASHMGHPDFRANGKIFATLQLGDRGMVKLSPEQQAQFVARAPAAFAPESGAWGRQGCTRVILTHADPETVGEAMTLAWQNVNALRTRNVRSSGSRRPTAGPVRRVAAKKARR